MNEPLAGGWTLEKLKAKSAEERFNVWVNAHRMKTPESLALARFIETSGLEYAEQGGISMSDPRVIEMDAIITSTEGRHACIDAVNRGLPGLAGVEPLIRARMGDRYGAFSQMTVTAGSLVGMLMYSLGYEKALPKKMPEGSIAKSAATWKPRKR